MNIKYHGLAKGKHVTQPRLFESLDTSGWISAAMSKKTEVWNANSTYSMFFGNKGKTMKPMLNHALEVYKENLEKIDNLKEYKLLEVLMEQKLKEKLQLLKHKMRLWQI